MGIAEGSDDDLVALAFDAADALLVVLDPDGRLVRLNRAAAKVAAVPVTDLLGALVRDTLLPPTDVESFEAHVRACVESGETRLLEHSWIGDHGNRRRISWAYTPMGPQPAAPGARVHVVGSGTDVTEARKHEAALRQLAETDPLTGLPNRTAFLDVLAQHLDAERGVGCGLLFCDLDGFKAVNDTRGHAMGDRLLVEVAGRLRGVLRDVDFIARIGGDEFVVVLPAVGELVARAVTARMERTVARPYRIDGSRVDVGISIGVRAADAGEDPISVLADADAAMYARKARRSARRLAPAPVS